MQPFATIRFPTGNSVIRSSAEYQEEMIADAKGDGRSSAKEGNPSCIGIWQLRRFKQTLMPSLTRGPVFLAHPV